MKANSFSKVTSKAVFYTTFDLVETESQFYKNVLSVVNTLSIENNTVIGPSYSHSRHTNSVKHKRNLTYRT